MDPEELQDKSDLVGVVEELQQEVLELSERVDSLPTEPVVIEGPPGPAGESIQGPAGKDAVPPSLEELEAIILPLIPDPIPGNDGADPTPLFKTLEDKVNKRLNSLGGGNLPGRQWNVNSSVLGTTFLDVNIIAPGATVTSNPDTKRTDLTLPSGGGTPGAPDASVQFNDGGNFGGSTLLFTQGLGNAILSSAYPNGIQLAAADAPTGSGDSGKNFMMTGGGGSDAGGNGGRIIAQGGDAQTDGDGGRVTFSGGGGGASSGSGGDVRFTAGSAQAGDGDGGDVTLTPGDAAGVGVPGHVIVNSLPSSDPGIPGAIYQVGGVLMISL